MQSENARPLFRLTSFSRGLPLRPRLGASHMASLADSLMGEYEPIDLSNTSGARALGNLHLFVAGAGTRSRPFVALF